MNKKKIKLQSGDILSFELEPNKYGFAKVIGKLRLGDVIEIYDYFSEDPNDYKEALNHSLLFRPTVIDGHSLFWKRREGNWALMERNNDFHLSEEEKASYKFRYGVKGLYKLIDLNWSDYPDVSQEEAEKYPMYAIEGDGNIKGRINFLLNKRKEEKNK